MLLAYFRVQGLQTEREGGWARVYFRRGARAGVLSSVGSMPATGFFALGGMVTKSRLRKLLQLPQSPGCIHLVVEYKRPSPVPIYNLHKPHKVRHS